MALVLPRGALLDGPDPRAFRLLGPHAVRVESGFDLPESNIGPHLHPVLALHRGREAFVSFHRKLGGEFQNLCSVRVGDLEAMFPAFVEELERDSYFSVNSYYRGGFGRSKYVPGVPGAYRDRRGLRYLNACYADLDCYKQGVGAGATIGRLIDDQDAGSLPGASIIARSGQGVWAFWLLHDPDDPRLPQRAWNEKVDLYLRIQRAVGLRLSRLGADAQARDSVRVTRVPGSVHSGSGARVDFWLQLDECGSPFSYTLEQLAESFEVPVRKYAPGLKEIIVDEGMSHRKRKGWRALYAKRLRQFERLRAIRGGFQDGCRHRAALLYANFLLKNGVPHDEAVVLVRGLGAECLPPLRPTDCDDAVGQAAKVRKLYDQTISDSLMITPGESARLESWPAATKHTEAAPAGGPPLLSKVEARRLAIKEIVRELGRVPPVREMSERLRARSIRIRHARVHDDYKVMGIDSGRRGRGTKTAAGMQGGLFGVV